MYKNIVRLSPRLAPGLVAVGFLILGMVPGRAAAQPAGEPPAAESTPAESERPASQPADRPAAAGPSPVTDDSDAGEADTLPPTIAPAAPVAFAQPPKARYGLNIGDHVFIAPHVQYLARFMVNGKKDFKEDSNFTAFGHRARLGVEATVLEHYTGMIQLQDVRLWGEEINTLGDYSAAGFDVHQAWFQVGCPMGLAVKIGRQELAYDNQRLIGSVGWALQARSFDAIKLSYNSAALSARAEVFYAMVGEKDAHVADAAGKTVKGSPDDWHLTGLWARYTGLEVFRPSLIVLFDHKAAVEQNRVTMGLFVDGAPFAGFKYTGEFYFQTGSAEPGGLSQDISAYMGAVGLGYTLAVPMSPSLSLWVEYLSGDDTKDTTTSAFDTLFATNHKFYGFMDLFLNVPVHVRGLGLLDVGGRVKVKPAKGLLVFLDFHHFEQAKKDPATFTTTLGNEVDILARYTVNKHFSVEGVFGVFLPKLGIRQKAPGRGKDAELYGYLQGNFNL